jgi:hypothetical protein
MVAAYRLLAPLWQPRTPTPLRLPTNLSSPPPFSLNPHLAPNTSFRRERWKSIVLAFGLAVLDATLWSST